MSTYNMGEYYERASDYDLEYQGQTEQDVPFWCELLMPSHEQKLGSRHVYPLSREERGKCRDPDLHGI